MLDNNDDDVKLFFLIIYLSSSSNHPIVKIIGIHPEQSEMPKGGRITYSKAQTDMISETLTFDFI